jgi:hypothetical protein
MHASLKSSPYRRVELPGDVGCAEDEHAFGVLAYAVHLYEHFGFYAPRGFGFAFTAGTAERVDFVDEDDAGFVFAGHVEQLFYQPMHISRC